MLSLLIVIFTIFLKLYCWKFELVTGRENICFSRYLCHIIFWSLMLNLKEKLYIIIFESDTKAGKAFDVALLWAILISVVVVMLESVDIINIEHGTMLRAIEWTFTGIFTVEYLLRIYSSHHTAKYIRSFLGVIDFIAIVPSYLSLIIAGSQYLLVLRTVRLLRVFRIFKLSRYLGEASILVKAMKASRYKITVFLGTVLSIVIIMGTLMYLVEGPENGFTSIPKSVYWAVVTLTTVGYGDIAPQTIFGQLISSMIMIIGYGIIAVPTGIVTVELNNISRFKKNRVCSFCGNNSNESDASFCKICGKSLPAG